MGLMGCSARKVTSNSHTTPSETFAAKYWLWTKDTLGCLDIRKNYFPEMIELQGLNHHEIINILGFPNNTISFDHIQYWLSGPKCRYCHQDVANNRRQILALEGECGSGVSLRFLEGKLDTITYFVR